MVRVTREEVEQGRTLTLPRGSRNVEKVTASKHCALLQLLGVDLKQEEKYRSCHGTHAQWHFKNVGIFFQFFWS